MNLRFRLFLIPLLASGLALVGSEQVFTSDQEHLSLRDNWRAVDMPSDLEVWSMDASAAAEVWIGAMASAACYDGTTWKNFPLPTGIDGGPVKAIRRSRSGTVYALTPVGLFALSDEVWRKVADVVSRRVPTGAIFESKNGDLWIGHDEGLAVLHGNGRLQNIETGEYVVSFCEDAEGSLWWVEGEHRKVYRSRPAVVDQRDQWELMLPAYREPVRFAALMATPDGRIWLSDIKRSDHLRYYDLKARHWVERDLASVAGVNGAFDLAQDAQGRLWVCTGNALVMIDGERMQRFSPEDGLTAQTWSPVVVQFAPDNSLWFTRVRGRPYRLDLNGAPWRTYPGLHYQGDAFGSRWFIDQEGEIVSFALDGPAAKPVEHRRRGAIDHPVGIFVSKRGEVWAIGGHGGAAAFAIYDGTAWTRQTFPDFATGFDFDSFCERADGSVVLGSGQFWDAPPSRPGGVLEVRRKGQEWVTQVWPNSPEGFPDRVHKIVETPNGDLFAGGSRFIRLRAGRATNENRTIEATGAWISSLKVAPDGTLWGSSYGRGIFRAVGPDRYEWFRSFEHGLNDVAIIDLVVLKGGDVVALTNSSLYRFDGAQWTEVLRLPLSHPLPEGGGSLKVGSDGALWLNVTHPDWYFRWSQGNDYNGSLSPRFASFRYEFDTLPPVATLNIVRTGGKETNSFTGTVEAWDPLSHTARRNLKYSFRVDGGAWSTFSHSHSHTLHQLPEGTHRLEARARDLDFNFNPVPAVATVTVSIPFWRESWFVPTLIVCSFAGALVYLVTFRNRARQVLELEHQKLNFFTNLSHEIRTPLALIMAPLERALRFNKQAEVSEYLQQARRSAEELKRIVDQLLDFRRAQSGVMQSSPENTDLVVFVADLVKSFGVMAGERKQTVIFETDLARLPCRADVVKLQGVLNNLVLNGLRYSPEGSEVRVILSDVSSPRSLAIFTVEDRGFGMGADFQQVALKPFTRGGDGRVRAVKGTGIGLAYVSELMKVCEGSIEILSPLHPEDAEHPGTRVTIRMPIEPLPIEAEEPAAPSAPVAGPETAEHPEDEVGGLPVLLLIEDDREMGAFLGRELQPAYRVLWEHDGEAGLRVARQEIPDLILTDRMLPKLDGFEVCRALRADLATAHIPVIMLTAASSRSNEAAALNAGVNDFLGKPFSIEALEQRLRNQLSIRDGLRAKLKRDIEQIHDEAEAAKIEDPFLRKANEVVEAHSSDYLFDTDALAGKLAMSRSSLYRKMHATMDLSPPAFIRAHRIRRAGQLLMGTTMGVAEIMEAVGVLEQRTFNKWFKSSYGCNPTEYRNRRVSHPAKVRRSE